MRGGILAIALGALLLAACGHPCNANTCAGCCDTNQLCQPGDEFSACGAGGAACAVCDPGQTCGGKQSCSFVPSATGGSSGSTGSTGGSTSGGSGSGNVQGVEGFAVQAALARFSDATHSDFQLDLANAPWTCADLGQDGGAGANRVVHARIARDGSAALTPADYAIPGNVDIAELELRQLQGGVVQQTLHAQPGGTLTIGTVGAAQVAGSFSVALPTPDGGSTALVGTFDAALCP